MGQVVDWFAVPIDFGPDAPAIADRLPHLAYGIELIIRRNDGFNAQPGLRRIRRISDHDPVAMPVERQTLGETVLPILSFFRARLRDGSILLATLIVG